MSNSRELPLHVKNIFEFQLLESGYRMECPPGCPGRVYSLMRECWHWEDGRRPAFRQIHHDMEHMFQVSSSTNTALHNIPSVGCP